MKLVLIVGVACLLAVWLVWWGDDESAQRDDPGAQDTSNGTGPALASPHRVPVAKTETQVRVVAVDKEDGPLSGAEVTIDGAAGLQTADTDASGEALLIVSPGFGDLTVRADGYETATRTLAIQPNGSTWRVRLREANLFRFRVVDQDGTPVDGATAILASARPDAMRHTTSRLLHEIHAQTVGHSDALGWVALTPRILRDTGQVVAAHAERGLFGQSDVDTLVSKGELPCLKGEAATVAVRDDETGRYVGRFQFELILAGSIVRSTFHESDVQVSLPSLWEVEGIVRVSAPGYAPQSLYSIDWSPTLTFELTRHQQLRVRVLDADSKQPIEGATVHAAVQRRSETLASSTARSDKTGSAKLPVSIWDRDVVRYHFVSAHAPGYTASGIEVSDGTDFSEAVQITLRPGVACSATVLRSDGSPASDAVVFVRPQRDLTIGISGRTWPLGRTADRTAVATDAKGLALLGTLDPHERYLVDVVSAERGSASVVLDPAHGTNVTMRLDGRETTRVVVTNDAGQPVADAVVAFLPDTSVISPFAAEEVMSSWRRVTDGAGRVSFAGLPSVPGVLRVEATDHLSQATPLAATAATAKIELTRTANISGTVAPLYDYLVGKHVRARALAPKRRDGEHGRLKLGPPGWGRIRADGSFVIRGLAPGKPYELEIFRVSGTGEQASDSFQQIVAPRDGVRLTPPSVALVKVALDFTSISKRRRRGALVTLVAVCLDASGRIHTRAWNQRVPFSGRVSTELPVGRVWLTSTLIRSFPHAAWVDVEEGATIEIPISDGSWDVHVRQPDGAPIAGATITLRRVPPVYIRPRDGPPRVYVAGEHRAICGPDGNASIPAPKSGKWVMYIEGKEEPVLSGSQTPTQPVVITLRREVRTDKR